MIEGLPSRACEGNDARSPVADGKSAIIEVIVLAVIGDRCRVEGLLLDAPVKETGEFDENGVELCMELELELLAQRGYDRLKPCLEYFFGDTY